MSFWNSLKISASGLSAQRLRLDVISNNIANSETTRTDDGTAYKRQDVVFASNKNQSPIPSLILSNQKTTNANHISDHENGVRVAAIVEDDSPGTKVYEPTHPDADEDGYVIYPNVNLVVEMTNMLSATRSYEANLSAIEASKSMALRALDIGS